MCVGVCVAGCVQGSVWGCMWVGVDECGRISVWVGDGCEVRRRVGVCGWGVGSGECMGVGGCMYVGVTGCGVRVVGAGICGRVRVLLCG